MAIEITTEDRDMFRFIHDHGGIVHKDLLKKYRWPLTTVSAMDKRIGKLIEFGWLCRADGKAALAGLYWLGWSAAIQLAIERGKPVSEPASEDGKHPDREELRKLAKRLKPAGISWTDEPVVSMVDHSRKLAEIQFAFEQGCTSTPGIELLKLEQFDQSHPSPTPDLFFAIGRSSEPNMAARFSLEFDNTTHAIDKLIDEKIVGGLEYLKSASRHKSRAGQPGGRWLFVFDSASRMADVQKRTQKAVEANARLFLFSELKEVVNGNPIADPIWHVGDGKTKTALLEAG
jgi:hypothetical protein